MALQRLVFISSADLLQGASPRPRLIGPLLDLQRAGYGLVLQARPAASSAPDEAAVLRLLAEQGVDFAQIVRCEHAGVQDCPCQAPHIAAVRPWLDALDPLRSAVVGFPDAVGRTYAANLGVPWLALPDGAGAWQAAADYLQKQPRSATIARRTNETSIDITVNLDGTGGATRIHTGIGFFDHMLEQLARHGGMGLQIAVVGDLHIDEHHTVEDTAIALGQALKQALGDRFGLERYGFVLPMDEALVTAALDLSGRAHLTFKGEFPRAEVGGLATELVPHFFRSLCDALGATLHVEVHGDNAHHMVEGVFKGVARCFRQAIRRGGDAGIPSTKGVL